MLSRLMGRGGQSGGKKKMPDHEKHTFQVLGSQLFDTLYSVVANEDIPTESLEDAPKPVLESETVEENNWLINT